MPSLKDIARQISGLAVAKAPKRTGNLKKQLQRANTPSQVLNESKNGFSFEINYAPPGAEYGKFVEEGTVKMKKRPFAEEAANDPLLKRQIDNAVNGIIQTTIMNAVDIGLKRAFRRLPS